MSRFDIASAKAICLTEMSTWGLVSKGWTFATDSRTTRHGWCAPAKKIIGLSRISIKHNSDEDVIDTIRHEIAHALHYEHCVDNNIEYGARKWTGRKWVRKIRPHGPQWQRFARMVGANPQATSNEKAAPTTSSAWRAVVVKNGILEDTGAGCQRFLKNLHTRYMRGRKDMIGHMYLVDGSHWNQVVEGKRSPTALRFYQAPNRSTQFTDLTLKV